MATRNYSPFWRVQGFPGSSLYPPISVGSHVLRVPGILGAHFHVENSSNKTGNDGESDGVHPDKPWQTLNYAFQRLQADSRGSIGDIIHLGAGHTETISAAAGLDCDVADVQVIGYGQGSNRPTFTLDTATGADIDIDAANITFYNCIFDLTGVDAITAGIDVNAAGFRMINCEVIMSDSGGQAVLGVLTDASADDMTIENCVFKGSTDAGPAAAIRLVGCDRPTIRNCVFTGDYSVGNISVLTTAATNVLIEGNDFNNLNAVDVNIEGLASTTGTIRYNTCRVATDAQTTWINTPGSTQLFENYGVNNNGERGIAIGTASV